MSIVAFIFARGGSKGLPGKNTLPLLGKPLIAWSIEQAKAVSKIQRIIVSTDSEDIATVAREYGAEVPFIRPSELAQDDSPEWLAWKHALSYLKDTDGKLPDVMISIPTTSPLRQPSDIENCLTLFSKGGADAVITMTKAHRNPWFNMVKKADHGSVELVNQDDENVFRRQDASQVFDITTVAYVVSPYFVMNEDRLFNGRVKAVEVPAERAIDIDTLYDFKIAEALMSNNFEEL